MNKIEIKEGSPNDVHALLELIKELALYEKAPQEVVNTTDNLLQDGFGEKPIYKFWLAWHQEQPVGMAVVYFRYSTWKGKCLYLEDLYVQPNYRKMGIGEMFFEVLKDFARKEQCRRITWQVLEWNEPAIQFYKKIGATLDNQWVNGFLEIS